MSPTASSRIRRLTGGDLADRDRDGADSRDRADSGAAVAEFVMISGLLVFLLFAVLQVAVLFYVRNIVAASAADGARYASQSGVAAQAGGPRASSEIAHSTTAGVATDVPCTGTVSVDQASGLPTTVVHCVGSIKSIFLPFGALVHIDVTARALTEPPP